MIEISNRRWRLEWALYLVVSAFGCVAVHVSLSRSAPVAVLPVAIFYGPAWLITNRILRRHSWCSPMVLRASIVIAVLGQNALIWWVLRFIGNRLLERKQSRSGGP